MSTTIADIIQSRAERGLADLLLTIYDAAYCAGANLPSEAPADPGVRDLVSTIAGRHRAEILAARGWIDPPLLNDEIPGWLLALRERYAALGDATPPDGWEAVALGGQAMTVQMFTGARGEVVGVTPPNTPPEQARVFVRIRLLLPNSRKTIAIVARYHPSDVREVRS
jgi:hypothetical protein